ncbi:hypothetical protein [Paraburkholderia sp. J94]|uniref:hypothetical protein n=1 Tax=Paraburkholderia sp. J94 TaxID=2805441 RepID=UPI002AB268ED|nr:hypothetical protein [Paraburkholderia sp. J94]
MALKRAKSPIQAGKYPLRIARYVTIRAAASVTKARSLPFGVKRFQSETRDAGRSIEPKQTFRIGNPHRRAGAQPFSSGKPA